MQGKAFSIINNVLFGIVILLGSYVLISTFLIRRSLPPGVCPIDNNRMLMYVTIGLAVASFVMSLFEKKKIKN